MVEFDVKKYDSVWIPLPRIFYFNWVAPRLYSQVNNIRLQAGYKDNGDLDFVPVSKKIKTCRAVAT